MKSVIYVSEGCGLRSLIDLHKLLPQARLTNSQEGISGMLMYDGERFLHIIEGKKKAVDVLVARIAMDQRHGRMKVLWDKPIQERWMSTFSAGLIVEKDDAARVSQLLNDRKLPTRKIAAVCLEIAIHADDLPY